MNERSVNRYYQGHSPSVEINNSITIITKEISEQEFQEKSYREINILDQLIDNPCTLHYINKAFVNKPPKYYIDIQFNYSTNQSLISYKENLDSHHSTYEFSNKSLHYCKKLIRYFAYLQKKNILKTNIALSNILVQADKDLVISDFSSVSESFLEIQSSENFQFLSPEQREKFAQFLDCVQTKNFTFKNSVFSLGLVLLYIVNLEPFTGRTEEDRTLYINASLEGLKIPSLYNIIRKMLEKNPENRPDFLELENMLIEGNFFSCFECNSDDFLNRLTCENCFRDYHAIRCVNSIQCPFCMKILYAYCGSCQRKFLYLEERNYLICNICIDMSQKRVLPEVNWEISGFTNPAARHMLCPKCRNECLKLDSSYFCRRCKREFCLACKRRSHDRRNLKFFLSYSFVCSCKSKVVRKEVDELFFFCQICGHFKCIVCLKQTIKASHVDCAKLFTFCYD